MERYKCFWRGRRKIKTCTRTWTGASHLFGKSQTAIRSRNTIDLATVLSKVAKIAGRNDVLEKLLANYGVVRSGSRTREAEVTETIREKFD